VRAFLSYLKVAERHFPYFQANGTLSHVLFFLLLPWRLPLHLHLHDHRRVGQLQPKLLPLQQRGREVIFLKSKLKIVYKIHFSGPAVIHVPPSKTAQILAPSVTAVNV
jgi:hypothetical protein